MTKDKIGDCPNVIEVENRNLWRLQGRIAGDRDNMGVALAKQGFSQRRAVNLQFVVCMFLKTLHEH
jgi:hypothetical protein